jgi:hypothetical protein
MGGAIVAVYEGVLEELSGGSVLHGSAAISEMATQGSNITHREFIVIGGKRIMDVTLSNRQDALLVSSLGQQVRVSAAQRGKGIVVMGLRLADGTVDKYPIGPSVLVQSVSMFVPVVFLVIVGFIGLVANAPIVALIAFGLAVLIVRGPVLMFRKMSAARDEL